MSAEASVSIGVLDGPEAYHGVRSGRRPYRHDSGPVRSMRAAHERRPVTEAALNALLESRMAAARSDADRDRLRQALRETQSAELMPAHGSRILVDPDGHLWIADYHAPGDPTRGWHVFDPEGQYLGQLDLPADLRLTDVRADAVLGVWTDDLGVQSVRVYPLDRG